MPLYRYECESCGNQFTVLVRQQSQADDPVCPKCGSEETQRMVPRVAVQFKGSGYYKTDYARNGKAKSSAGSKTTKDTGSRADDSSQSKSQVGDTQSSSTSSSKEAGSNTEVASGSKKNTSPESE